VKQLRQPLFELAVARYQLLTRASTAPSRPSARSSRKTSSTGPRFSLDVPAVAAVVGATSLTASHYRPRSPSANKFAQRRENHSRACAGGSRAYAGGSQRADVRAYTRSIPSHVVDRAADIASKNPGIDAGDGR
jgi:hypothetical protein